MCLEVMEKQKITANRVALLRKDQKEKLKGCGDLIVSKKQFFNH